MANTFYINIILQIINVTEEFAVLTWINNGILKEYICKLCDIQCSLVKCARNFDGLACRCYNKSCQNHTKYLYLEPIYFFRYKNLFAYIHKYFIEMCNRYFTENNTARNKYKSYYISFIK